MINNQFEVLYQYNKKKLVPFGEFLPFENILSKIGLKKITEGHISFSEGKKQENIRLKNLNILPLICYEIIFPELVQTSSNNTNLIINISEDGWFGNSVGPHQHFAHSILRSVEYGKYTLRSANNGISAIIDPTGATIDKIDIKNEGIISLKEFVNVDTTLFSTYGNKIYFLIILLYIFLIFSFKKIKNE